MSGIYPFLDLVSDFWYSLLSLLNDYHVVGGVTITEMLFGFLVLSLIISVFWKGGRA